MRAQLRVGRLQVGSRETNRAELRVIIHFDDASNTRKTLRDGYRGVMRIVMWYAEVR
jgi:hypothetical protein